MYVVKYYKIKGLDMSLDELEGCQGKGTDKETPSADEDPIKSPAETDAYTESHEACVTEHTSQSDVQNNNNEKEIEHCRDSDGGQENPNLETYELDENKPLSLSSAEEADVHYGNNERVAIKSDTQVIRGLSECLNSEDKSETVSEIYDDSGTINVGCIPTDGNEDLLGGLEISYTQGEDSLLKNTVNNTDTLSCVKGVGVSNIQESIAQEEVIQPNKTILNTCLANSYFDEEYTLRLGCANAIEGVHIIDVVENLQEDTSEKSFDEELNEDFADTTEHKSSEQENESDAEDFNGEIVKEQVTTKRGIYYRDSGNKHSTPSDNLETVAIIETNVEGKVSEIAHAAIIKHTFKGNIRSADNPGVAETVSELGNSILEQCKVFNVLVNTECINQSANTIFDKEAKHKGIAEQLDETDERSKNEVHKEYLNGNLDTSDYDADSSDTETEEIERTNAIKEALLYCLKDKCETFERAESRTERTVAVGSENQVNCIQKEQTVCYCLNEVNGKAFTTEYTTVSYESDISEQMPTASEFAKHVDDYLEMPETQEGVDRSVSPSLMYASCRYRWERTILTQSLSIVFVTLNNKEIEPIKLEWSDSSRCFYSDEVKIPVGVYVGNLVIDGTFYPVEDITVKHYTFEVDLYLKDDILEDEGHSSGVAKAEEFIKQKQQSNGKEAATPYRNKDYSYTPSRASGYTYSTNSARMEEESLEQIQGDGSIHVTSKYEELVRSQMNQNNGSLNGIDSENESGLQSKSDYLDLGGRGTPVGEDGVKQYQDGTDAAMEMGQHLTSKTNVHSQNAYKYDPLIDDFFEQRNPHSNSSITNSVDSLERKTPPAVIDDVLGNGHARTPIYSTESPVYSKHSSAHSSARQTPTASEHSRPDSITSVGSMHSANSTSNHVLDDLINVALARPRMERESPASEHRDGSRAGSTPTRPESVGSAHSENSLSRRAINDLIEESLNISGSPSPLRENSVHSSRPDTPPPTEQIADVLNPSDRHSPIRRDFLTNSPSVSNHSAKSSGHNSAQGSAPSSQRHTPQRDLISNSLRASQEKLYNAQEMRRLSGHEAGSSSGRAGSDHSGHAGSGSNASSRPQSLTSEQELTQYYEEHIPDGKAAPSVDTFGTIGPRSGSASSLPAIGNQQRYIQDKRSMTPDNHIRVPVVGPIPKTSLLPNRTPPRTPLSNSSSRTVTPMNAESDAELRLREQIKDSEGTVSSLRNLLASREQEVVELKGQFSEIREINEKLQGDLDRHRARASPGPQIAELERKLRDACDERENLNAEVFRLKDELQRKLEPGLNSFDPNSPSALHRKIDDLNSQIQDLHEAHDAASEDILAAERRVKELAGENETLRVTQSEKVRDIEDENRHLKSEVQRLRDQQMSHSDATDYRLKIELQQVKEDNQNLRERNYQLHDDNIRMKEELFDLRKSLELMDSIRKPQKDEGKPVRPYDAYERNAVEMDKTMESSYHNDHGYTRLSDPLPERRTERDRESYSSTMPNYDAKPRYDVQRSEVLRADRDYKEDRLTKSDATRYESYRTGPDGGSSDKLRSSLGYSRPLTQERTSTLVLPKRDNSFASKSQERINLGSRTLDRGDLDRARRERSRTSSAEVEFRSMPLSAYNGDLSTPALTGRSRDTRKQHLPETVDDIYTKREVNLIQQRKTLEKEVKHLEKQVLLSSLTSQSAYDDDGNMSDTPTDILVNIEPIDNITAASWSRGRQRRGSAGSDASNSSFSDIDEQITASVRIRSKSVDGRGTKNGAVEVKRRMGPTGKENMTLSRTMSPAPSAVLRSITPGPIVTQHNKSALSLSSSLNSLTQGLRPFAPRSAQDLQICDVIKFSRQGGKLSQGTIKFIGHLPGRGDIYLGVELDKEDGKHDGVFEGIRYFHCKPSKGVFVAYNKVVMAWTVYKLV